MTEPQEIKPQVSNRIGNNYGLAIQAGDIGTVQIWNGQDKLWEKRHAAYERYTSVWAQFQAHMRNCEKILAQPPNSANMQEAEERHADMVDEWRMAMDGIALVYSDITAAKEALQAAIAAMQAMNDRLRIKVAILHGEHFTGHVLQEHREKMDAAQKIADEKYWEFLTLSSRTLGINREAGAVQ